MNYDLEIYLTGTHRPLGLKCYIMARGAFRKLRSNYQLDILGPSGSCGIVASCGGALINANLNYSVHHKCEGSTV